MVHTADHDAEHSCPRCGSGHVDLVDNMTVLICLDCGYENAHEQTREENDRTNTRIPG